MLNPSTPRLKSGVAAFAVYVITASVLSTVLMPIVAPAPAHAQGEQDRRVHVSQPEYDFACSVAIRFTDKNLRSPCGFVPISLSGFQPGTYDVDCVWTNAASADRIVIKERVIFRGSSDGMFGHGYGCFFDDPPGEEVHVTIDEVDSWTVRVEDPRRIEPTGRERVTLSLGPVLVGGPTSYYDQEQGFVNLAHRVEEVTGESLSFYNLDSECYIPCRLLEVTLHDFPPGKYRLEVYLESSGGGLPYITGMSDLVRFRRGNYSYSPWRYYGPHTGEHRDWSHYERLADDESEKATVVGFHMYFDHMDDRDQRTVWGITDYDSVVVHANVVAQTHHWIDDPKAGTTTVPIAYAFSNRLRLGGQVPLPRLLSDSAEVLVALGDSVTQADTFEVAPIEHLLSDAIPDDVAYSSAESRGYWLDIILKNFEAGDYWIACWLRDPPSLEGNDYFFLEYGGRVSHDGSSTVIYDRVCKSTGSSPYFTGDLRDGDYELVRVMVGGRVGRIVTGADGEGASRQSEGSDSEASDLDEGERSPESALDTGGEPGLPGLPRDLQLVLVGEASRDEFEFKIEWFAPVVGDGGAVRDYVVSVSTPSVPDLWPVSWIGLLLGPVEETFFVERTVMPYRGAHDQRYTVSVAARNANGVGPAVTREIETPPRPWTCAVDPGQRKYELETTGGGWVLPWRIGGVTRIKALQDFTTVNGLRVSKGVRGGQVDGARNLSQSGCSWIAYGASVSDNAVVSGDGVVAGNARVEDDAEVGENAVISGQAKLFDNAKVYGSARVTGKARIDDHASIYGEAKITGSAHVYDSAEIYESAEVSGEGRVYHHAEVFGNALVTGDADVHGDEDRPRDSAKVHGDAVIRGDARIHGTAVVSGEIEFAGDIDIDEGEYDGDVEYLRLATSVVQAIYEDNLDLLSRCTSTRNWSEPERRRNAKSMVEREILGKPVPSINFDISEILRLDCLRWKATWELLGSVTPSPWEFALQYGLVLLRAIDIPRTIKIPRLMRATLDYAGHAQHINDIRELLDARGGLEETTGRINVIRQEEDLLHELLVGSLSAIDDDRIRFIEVEGDTRIQGQLKSGRWTYF